MTTQEAHIHIDLELQKINSQNTKNILPQEKDWFINREMIRYLQKKINPSSDIKKLGFEDNAKRVEDIKDLITTKNLHIEVNNQGVKYVTLPYDYFQYIRFDANLRKVCDTPVINSTVLNYKTKFKIVIENNTTSYTITLVKPFGNVEIFSLLDLPTNYLGNVEFKKQSFLLIKALKIKLLDKLKENLSPNVLLYWERIGYDFNSYTFTLISDVEFSSIIINKNTVDTTYNKENIIVPLFNKIDYPLKSKIRIVDDEFLSEIEGSHLSKNKMQSPLSVLRKGVLELSKLPSAIFGSINIVYICVPTIIDLLLDSNFNVSDKVAFEVLDNTIANIKQVIQSKDYESYTKRNILIE